jgi:hypothetical protein
LEIYIIEWKLYKEGTKIFAIEIEYVLSQIFMGHDENP